jgi:hypothetical protein
VGTTDGGTNTTTTGGVTAQNTRGSSGTGGGTAQEQSDGRVQVGPGSLGAGDTKPAGTPQTAGKIKSPTAGTRVDEAGNQSNFYTDGEGNDINQEEYYALVEKVTEERKKEETSGGVVSYLQKKAGDIYWGQDIDSLIQALKSKLESGEISKEVYEQGVEILEKRRGEIQAAGNSVTDDQVAQRKQQDIDSGNALISGSRESVKGKENKSAYDKIVADIKSGKIDTNAGIEALTKLSRKIKIKKMDLDKDNQINIL